MATPPLSSESERLFLLACTAGDFDCVQRCVAEGFPVHACRDQEDWTPLMRAVVSAGPRAREVVNLLLTGATGPAQLRAQNKVRAPVWRGSAAPRLAPLAAVSAPSSPFRTQPPPPNSCAVGQVRAAPRLYARR